MSEFGNIVQSVDGSVVDTLNEYHIPEIFLGFVGILALLIVYFYLKDKDSGTYKFMVLIGVIAGIVMALLCLSSSLKGELWTLLIVALASFTLIIRPFRDIKFMVVVALFIMAIVFISLGKLTGNLEFLATGWPRVVIALIAGAIVYVLLLFVQEITLLFGKFFNAWPILGVLGIICIAEAICVGMGYGSIINLLMGHLMEKSEFLLIQ